MADDKPKLPADSRKQIASKARIRDAATPSAGGGAKEPSGSQRGAKACPSVSRKSIQETAMIAPSQTAPTVRSEQAYQSGGSSRANEVPPPAHTCPNPQAALGLDQSAQLRSTLAIGQLIASNRPTAGSRLIASELRQLTKTIREEASLLKQEVASLSSNLANTLKRVLDDDREQRSLGATGGGLVRRPMFGSFATRRFPVFRRPRRLPPLTARKSPGRNGGTSSPLGSNATVSPPSPEVAIKSSIGTQTSDTLATNNAQKQTASKLAQLAAAKSPMTHVAKAIARAISGWNPNDLTMSSYDGEVDTDSSNDTTPSASP